MGDPCIYCGNKAYTYQCNCGSDYASTSTFDKEGSSLNDPKPELGSGSSQYTGVRKPSYTSTQSTEYVGTKHTTSSSSDKKSSTSSSARK
ncbi:hypothetical protein H2200_006951 [Cladophialophora chaetospira]|uniref:Uncharacterized protein n=1 Tax=Cladophialophora chaetospira TaxID=386627 RepID=A0AA39CID0_9EURO|nr:hypothetical protein H2200_006951 [Cladophialophora chaetospira]